VSLVAEYKRPVQSMPAFVPVTRNRVLSLLTPAEHALLEPHISDVLLHRGAVLHDGSDTPAYVYFPHSGTVSILCASPREQVVETASVGREGIVGVAAGMIPHYRAVVQISGTASRISAERFADAAAQSEAIRELVTAQTSLLLRQTQQNVVCGALHVVRGRICRWLSHARDRCGSDTLPLTQEAIAQAIGVQRTTVTLVLRMLQDEGLIRTMRGRILVREAAALQAQACACYNIVRNLSAEVPAPSNGLAAG
jgi:CRP-like cAMP-binding protein